MLDIWKKITFIGTVVGLILSIKAIVEERRIIRQIHKNEEDEFI